jgi:hypothetical protein
LPKKDNLSNGELEGFRSRIDWAIAMLDTNNIAITLLFCREQKHMNWAPEKLLPFTIGSRFLAVKKIVKRSHTPFVSKLLSKFYLLSESIKCSSLGFCTIRSVFSKARVGFFDLYQFFYGFFLIHEEAIAHFYEILNSNFVLMEGKIILKRTSNGFAIISGFIQ